MAILQLFYRPRLAPMPSYEAHTVQAGTHSKVTGRARHWQRRKERILLYIHRRSATSKEKKNKGDHPAHSHHTATPPSPPLPLPPYSLSSLSDSKTGPATGGASVGGSWGSPAYERAGLVQEKDGEGGRTYLVSHQTDGMLLLSGDPLEHRQEERHDALRGGDGRGQAHSSLHSAGVRTLALTQQGQRILKERLTARKTTVPGETEAQDLTRSTLNAPKGPETGGGDLEHMVSPGTSVLRRGESVRGILTSSQGFFSPVQRSHLSPGAGRTHARAGSSS